MLFNTLYMFSKRQLKRTSLDIEEAIIITRVQLVHVDIINKDKESGHKNGSLEQITCYK